MDRTFTLILSSFLTVGFCTLVVAAYLLFTTQQLLSHGIRTHALVTDLHEHLSGADKHGNRSTMYSPDFRFRSESGSDVTVNCTWSSARIDYDVGDTVEIVYPKADPSGAQIVGYFPLWGGATIAGILGTIFFLIGAVPLYLRHAKVRRDEFLRQHGTPVQTTFQGVEVNTTLRVNGRNPWRIVTRWQNPASGELHLYRSDNLWFDPAPFLSGKPIVVYIDQQRPRRACMDISFLPRLAE